MSNNTSDNSDNKQVSKSKARGPHLRIETAGDIPEEKLQRLAAKFAEVNEIEDYRLTIEQRDDIIGGFIIYFQGSRYDYSAKGQLDRIGAFMKRARSFDINMEERSLKESFFERGIPGFKGQGRLGEGP